MPNLNDLLATILPRGLGQSRRTKKFVLPTQLPEGKEGSFLPGLPIRVNESLEPEEFQRVVRHEDVHDILPSSFNLPIPPELAKELAEERGYSQHPLQRLFGVNPIAGEGVAFALTQPSAEDIGMSEEGRKVFVEEIFKVLKKQGVPTKTLEDIFNTTMRIKASTAIRGRPR